MSVFETMPESDFDAEFRLEALRRIDESRRIWASFAVTKRLRFSPGIPLGVPRLEGSIAGNEVAIMAVGDVHRGYRTRALTRAKHSLAGKVVVRAPGPWHDLIAQIRKRRFFGDAYLDERLVVNASSTALARTVLDPRVIETVKGLALRRLDELSYVRGLIVIEWGGVERDLAVLDDVLDVLGYLAVQGSELAPYR